MTSICVVTGTRAEYGLLRPVIEKISHSSCLDLQIIATGTHLSSEHGMTVEEIKADGFLVNKAIECLVSADTAPAITKSMGLALIGFSDALRDLQPDIILVLGDRFEILMAATAAMIFGVPIAHIQGGETTEGAIDEAIRHSITKMAHFHFVAADEYARRVIQLGENANQVHVVGGLGVENALTLPLLGKEELEASLKLRFSKKNILVTLHPETIGGDGSEHQIKQLLKALGTLKETTIIFTLPNADVDGRIITDHINRFTKNCDQAHAFTSLGALRYLSCVKYVDAVVGNSSSGLLEAPSFGTATINIGDRQKGRIRATSIVDVPCDAEQIRRALETIYSKEFQKILLEAKNPYQKADTSRNIIRILEKAELTGIQKKSFVDLH